MPRVRKELRKVGEFVELPDGSVMLAVELGRVAVLLASGQFISSVPSKQSSSPSQSQARLMHRPFTLHRKARSKQGLVAAD